MKVFTRYGYTRGTTNRIAEWADVSIGSLYQYYPSKDAIVVELATRHLDSGIAAVNARLSDEPPASVDEVMCTIVATAVGNHRQASPEFLRVLVEQASRSKELMARVEGLRDSSVEQMCQLLSHHPEVTVADKDTAARLIVTTIELVVHHAMAAPTPVETNRLGNELAAMLASYLTDDRTRRSS